MCKLYRSNFTGSSQRWYKNESLSDETDFVRISYIPSRNPVSVIVKKVKQLPADRKGLDEYLLNKNRFCSNFLYSLKKPCVSQSSRKRSNNIYSITEVGLDEYSSNKNKFLTLFSRNHSVVSVIPEKQSPDHRRGSNKFLINNKTDSIQIFHPTPCVDNSGGTFHRITNVRTKI